MRPPASRFFYPKSHGFPFYPVLAATVSLFASHSAGCCCQHMTLPSKVQQHHKGRFVGICTQAFFIIIISWYKLISNLLFYSLLVSLSAAQAIQSLFPRLPDTSRGTSLFDRGTTAPGPEGDKLRLDSFPFLSSGEQRE